MGDHFESVPIPVPMVLEDLSALAGALRQLASMADREAEAQTDTARRSHCEGEAHAYRDAAGRVEGVIRAQRRIAVLKASCNIEEEG